MFFESTPVDRFEELGGLDAEIARLQRVVRFRLQDEQLAARYKLKDKRGILLEGPLGNGKTKLARGTVFDSASSTIATGRRACGLACPIRAPGAAPPARNCCSAARRRGPVANLDAASDCDRPRFAVCLQALDIHYHELGGLYDRLHATGRMRDVVLSAGDVERATREPPAGGRAARGAFIRSVAGEDDWFAD